MEQFFVDMGFLDAERAYGAVLRHLPWPVLRHAKRNFFVRQHRSFDTPAPQPVAGRRHLPKRCFGSGCARPVATLKGAGGPHRTPALFAGIDAVPWASAPRRAGGETFIANSWENCQLGIVAGAVDSETIASLPKRGDVIPTPHAAPFSEDASHDLQTTAAKDVASVLSDKAPVYPFSKLIT